MPLLSSLKKLATVRDVRVGVQPPYTFYQISPDRGVKNDNNGLLAKAIYDLYKPPSERFTIENKALLKLEPARCIFKVVMKKDFVGFYIGFPRGPWEQYLLKKFKNTWSKCSLLMVDPSTFDIDVDQEFEVSEVKYKRHSIFSLDVDKRKMEFYDALMTNAVNIEEGEKTVLSYVIEPINHKDWVDQATEAYKTFRKGKMPRKLELNKRNVALTGVRLLAEQMQQVKGEVDQLMSPGQDKKVKGNSYSPYMGYGGYGYGYGMMGGGDTIVDPEVMELMLNSGASGRLQATMHKLSSKPYKVGIFVVSQGSNPEGMNKSIANAFVTMEEDNILEFRKIGKSHHIDVLETVENNKLPFDLNTNIMSQEEVAKLISLPTATIQDKYPEIQQIRHKEVDLPMELYEKSGIPFCVIKDRGKLREIFINTKNHNTLCMPHIMLGEMGTGKTTAGSNLAYEWITKAGYSAFVIDVADGKLVDGIRDALPPDFPEDHIIDLDLGNGQFPISLNWSELAAMGFGKDGMDRQIANRMSNAILEFVSGMSKNVMTDRMKRYLTAVSRAVMSDPNNGIMEIVQGLISRSYLDTLIGKTIDNPRLNDTLINLQAFSDAEKTKVTNPITDRLSVFMDDDMISNSILQRPVTGDDGKPLINFRKWADGDRYPYFVGIRVPKEELLAIPTDILVTFVIHKLWLAIMSRYDVAKEDDRIPCLLIMDEPHQFMSCMMVWDQMVREARKWRLKPVFLAHNFDDFKDMKKTLKDVGVQYSVFSTSKETYKALADELTPFELEDLMAMPERFWAVHARFKRGGDPNAPRIPAFMGNMYPSPPVVTDRSKIREKCSRTYGRPVRDVEMDIMARYHTLSD